MCSVATLRQAIWPHSILAQRPATSGRVPAPQPTSVGRSLNLAANGSVAGRESATKGLGYGRTSAAKGFSWGRVPNAKGLGVVHAPTTKNFGCGRASSANGPRLRSRIHRQWLRHRSHIRRLEPWLRSHTHGQPALAAFTHPMPRASAAFNTHRQRALAAVAHSMPKASESLTHPPPTGFGRQILQASYCYGRVWQGGISVFALNLCASPSRVNWVRTCRLTPLPRQHPPAQPIRASSGRKGQSRHRRWSAR